MYISNTTFLAHTSPLRSLTHHYTSTMLRFSRPPIIWAFLMITPAFAIKLWGTVPANAICMLTKDCEARDTSDYDFYPRNDNRCATDNVLCYG